MTSKSANKTGGAHARAHIDAPLKGIAYIVVGGMFLTISDAIVKWFSPGTPLGELVFIRGAVPLAIVLLMAARAPEGFAVLRTRDLKRELGRASATIVFTFLMIFAMRDMPLADCFAILFVAPAMLGLLAPRMLGERTGFHHWFAIGLGFVGVLLMLRPSGSGLHWIALIPVFCAFTSTLRDIFTRHLAAADALLTIQLYTNLGLFLAGGITFMTWKPLSALELVMLTSAGVFQYLGQHYFIDAFRYAGATTLAPFKYAILVWATLAGIVVWGDIPDEWTIGGSALIVMSGLYIARMDRAKHA